jgi:arginine decarboxylase
MEKINMRQILLLLLYKSSHFEFIMNEALKTTFILKLLQLSIILLNLMANGKINKSTYVICNGFKRDQYIENISRLINNGHKIQYLLLIILKN